MMSWGAAKKKLGESDPPPPPVMTESSALLQNNNIAEIPKAKEDSSTNDDDDDDVPTTSVELFFDLVVAAAINSLSGVLLGGDETAPDVTDWLWFVLRVFFVFNIWHSCLILNSIMDMYGSKESAQTGIHVITFTSIFLVVALVRTAQNDNNLASGVIYILGRAHVLIVGGVKSRIGHKRPSVSDSGYQHFLKCLHLSSILIPVECLPLAISIVFFRINQENGILIGGYTTAITFLLWRRVFARQIDDIPMYTHSEHHVVDLNHLSDRYEDITLALLGVLCILDQTEQSTYYVAFCSIVTAMSAFLLYFRARAWGRTEPWLVSAEASMQFPNLHILIFCVIPSMGVAFNEIVRDQDTKTDWHMDPHVLLCYFGSIFLVIVGLMDCLAEDPSDDESKRPRLKQKSRVAIYFLAGAALFFCGQFQVAWSHSEILVPAVFAVMAKLQIWATRPRGAG